MSSSIPQRLQGVLWSVDTKNLDLQKDKLYIIHQILAYGRMEDITWLFKTYPKSEITDVFMTHPYKDYSVSRFHFVKHFLLSLHDHSVEPGYYVKNIPRNIR